jgi:hypothetical protein
MDERIETLAGEIEHIGEKEANCRRLMNVPGIGPLISTAVAAAIGTGEARARLAFPFPRTFFVAMAFLKNQTMKTFDNYERQSHRQRQQHAA